MTTVRVVQGTRVLAVIRVETVTDETAVVVESGASVEVPAPAAPPARPRTWPAGLAWTAFGIVGLLAGSLLEASFWSPWNHSRWIGLALGAFAGLPALTVGAGLLFLVLKVVGRNIRFVDAMRALALLAWLPAVLTVASLAAYYPLSPQACVTFDGLLVAATAASSVAALASLRREPRSLRFTAGWATGSLAVILGLAALSSLDDVERGRPSIDLDLQAPIAGYAGTTESLDDYMASIRALAPPRPLETSATGGR
jgi:hypothetical protein